MVHIRRTFVTRMLGFRAGKTEVLPVGSVLPPCCRRRGDVTFPLRCANVDADGPVRRAFCGVAGMMVRDMTRQGAMRGGLMSGLGWCRVCYRGTINSFRCGDSVLVAPEISRLSQGFVGLSGRRTARA